MNSRSTATGPATIGRFRTTGLLGTGAFSAVYRAIDDRIGGEVAIKLLADHHSLDPDIRERFLAEARLPRRLTSPNVVRLYELDETEDHRPFHVLEYVSGGSLAAHRSAAIAAGRSVSVNDVLTVADDLRSALEVLHAERIVHRDLAPKTCSCDRAGVDTALPTDRAGDVLADGEQLVLADLGISKDLAESSGLTAAAGTHGYSAPEQRVVGVVDERVDVYAASAVLVWLVTGERPGDRNAEAVVAAGFPVELGAVLDEGLSPDPADRPQTIAEWTTTIRRAVGVEQADDASSPVEREPAAPSAWGPPTIAGTTGAMPARPPRRTLLAMLAALVVAAAPSGLIIGRSLGDGESDDAATEFAIADGTLRAERTVGDVTAAFDGPAQLVVGERATFIPDVSDNVASYAWVHGGNVYPDTGAIDINFTAAGNFTLTLIATAADGTAASATHTFTVETAPT